MPREDVKESEVKIDDHKTEVVEVEVTLGLINQKLNYIIALLEKLKG